ncbi:MAG: hypothetical protein LBR27_12070 [Bifidobacteriaceae bacterium]|nr:hypothetical protein [Bifidobacteriaceae bacterium]
MGRVAHAAWSLVVRGRAQLPRRADLLLERAKWALRRGGAGAVPPPGPEAFPAANASRPAVLLAPANFAGQAHAWAGALTAVEVAEGRNWAYVANPVFAFPASYVVPISVYAQPRAFFAELYGRVVDGFDAVVLESGRPLFGRLFGFAPERELAALREAGLAVALMWHGSDIRLPSWHVAGHTASPYALPQLRRRARELEATARRNRAALLGLGLPSLVSTPDLLELVPGAAWCPSVVALPDAAGLGGVLQRAVPRVVHVPSNPLLKGTDLIEPVLRRLASAGLIEYVRAEGLVAAQVLELYRTADIVLDQFRLGIYGVAACEAMAAGRVVVSDVDASVRATVLQETGLELPVVQATAAELETVLGQVLAERDHFRALAAQGRAFVEAIHAGPRSAAALAAALGLPR